MRLHNRAGEIVDLPAFPATEAMVAMLFICQRDLPRARFMRSDGEYISVCELRLNVEEIKALNPTTGS